MIAPRPSAANPAAMQAAAANKYAAVLSISQQVAHGVIMDAHKDGMSCCAGQKARLDGSCKGMDSADSSKYSSGM